MRLKATPISVRSTPTPASSTRPTVSTSPNHRGRRDLLSVLPIIALLAFLLVPAAGMKATTNGTLIISQSELSTRPTSGAAWDYMVSVARGSFGTPDLTDQNDQHGVRVLAAALVSARIGDTTLRTKARNGIMAAIGTEQVGANNSILSLGRQLSAYVMAADIIDLSGSDDTTFRAWLSAIRTRILGGHSIWDSLVHTDQSSANNWGAFAGASRIAASLYLGDTADVAKAAAIFQGWLGDRAASLASEPSGPTPSRGHAPRPRRPR